MRPTARSCGYRWSTRFAHAQDDRPFRVIAFDEIASVCHRDAERCKEAGTSGMSNGQGRSLQRPLDGSIRCHHAAALPRASGELRHAPNTQNGAEPGENRGGRKPTFGECVVIGDPPSGGRRKPPAACMTRPLSTCAHRNRSRTQPIRTADFTIKLAPIINIIESASSAMTSHLNRVPARPVVPPPLSFSGPMGSVRLACHAGNPPAIAIETRTATALAPNTRMLHCGCAKPLPN